MRVPRGRSPFQWRFHKSLHQSQLCPAFHRKVTATRRICSRDTEYTHKWNLCCTLQASVCICSWVTILPPQTIFQHFQAFSMRERTADLAPPRMSLINLRLFAIIYVYKLYSPKQRHRSHLNSLRGAVSVVPCRQLVCTPHLSIGNWCHISTETSGTLQSAENFYWHKMND